MPGLRREARGSTPGPLLGRKYSHRFETGDALAGRRDESESRVSDVMAPDPLRAALDAPVSEIAEMLVDEKIGAVPVVDEGDRPVGIVSSDGELVGIVTTSVLLRDQAFAETPGPDDARRV